MPPELPPRDRGIARDRSSLTLLVTPDWAWSEQFGFRMAGQPLGHGTARLARLLDQRDRRDAGAVPALLEMVRAVLRFSVFGLPEPH
jgi:hypothetical protein